MNLKNYTSSVDVNVTIARIEQHLIGTGLVSGIGKEYKGQLMQSLVFQIQYEKDKLPLTVKLAANTEQCLDFFWRDHCQNAKRNMRVKEDFREQAARTAWKLQEDWVRVETSLILLQQRTVLQSFMSYVWDGERTFYQRIKDSGFKQLAAPKEA